MKTKKYNLFAIALLALSLSLFSCSSEDGDLGPNGAKGEQGEIGPAGSDGSFIYSGEGEPLDATGVKGDYYFDVTTGMLYGPKNTTDKWDATDNFSLKGANGTNGTDGSQILSGEGEPEAADGQNGDFYLNTTSFTLYGPKMDNTWSVGLMLKGADGNANVRTFKLTILKDDWQTFADSKRNRLWKHLNIPAFTKDIFDNGIVLVNYKNAHQNRLSPLPISYVTNLGNHFKHSFYVSSKSVDGTVYNSISIEQCTYLTNDDSETLYKGDEVYHIKLISGRIAEQLNLNKNKQLVFDKLLEDLEE